MRLAVSELKLGDGWELCGHAREVLRVRDDGPDGLTVVFADDLEPHVFAFGPGAWTATNVTRP